MFVLVPSPFLGTSAWSNVRRALIESGESSAVLHIAAVMRGKTDFYARIGATRTTPKFDGAIWVAHSGGGALMPMLLTRAAAAASGLIMVDALMPHPGRAWLETIPDAFAAMIVEKSSEGRAPAWPTWFGARLAELLPNEKDREILVVGSPEVPLAFLRERAPDLDLPPNLPCAYLRLSASYADESNEAEARGWAVRVLDRHHLLPITRPAEVAAQIIELRDELRQRIASRDTV